MAGGAGAVKAMILAAGLGTRLQPLTDRLPKPLLPLMLVPMLGHLLARLRCQGVREVVINGHHLADRLAAWLGDGSRWGLRLTFVHEPEILGTAGALKNAEALLRGAPFLVINADVLADVDLQALWTRHRERGALVTMVVRPDPAARDARPVVIDEHDRVRRINGRPEEKERSLDSGFRRNHRVPSGRIKAMKTKSSFPRKRESRARPGLDPGFSGGSWIPALAGVTLWGSDYHSEASNRLFSSHDEAIFTGIQIVDPQVLDAIPANRFVSTTADTYPQLVQEGRPVLAHRYDGYWLDVGVPERYLQAHRDLLDGVLGTSWEDRLPAGSRVVRGTGEQQMNDATLIPPVVLGAGVTLAAGVRVGPYAVLGAGCRIGPDAEARESVLGDHATVGAGAVLRRCILGPGARVPSGQSLQEECLV